MKAFTSQKTSKASVNQHVYLYMLIAFVCCQKTYADVSSLFASDVTTRSVSLNWISDAEITSADIKVFIDVNGQNELTDGLSTQALSTTENGAYQLGVAKVQVNGLDSDSCYFFQTQTETNVETVNFPSTGNLLEVCTQSQTVKGSLNSSLIVNDVYKHQTFWPEGMVPSKGSLISINIPSVSNYPQTLIAGTDSNPSLAYLDLNNTFASNSGKNVPLAQGQVAEINEYRGLACANLESHKLTRFRKIPSQNELDEKGYKLINIETLDKCDSVDTVCDQKVDIIDVQYALNILNADSSECRFNPDIDVVEDGVVNVLDVQGILNFVGQTLP